MLDSKDMSNHLMFCINEECGEVTQAIGKILRFGFDSRTDIFATVDFIKRFKNDSRCLFRNPKITHVFSVLIFDEIIIEMTRIYNELYDFDKGSINEHIISR